MCYGKLCVKKLLSFLFCIVNYNSGEEEEEEEGRVRKWYLTFMESEFAKDIRIILGWCPNGLLRFKAPSLVLVFERLCLVSALRNFFFYTILLQKKMDMWYITFTKSSIKTGLITMCNSVHGMINIYFLSGLWH